LSKKSPELENRLKEVQSGTYDKEYKDMMKMGREELKKKYYARDSE